MSTKELFDNINSYHSTLIDIPYIKISCDYNSLARYFDVGIQLYKYNKNNDSFELIKYVYYFIYNDKDLKVYKNKVKKEIIPFIFLTSKVKVL